ncbi:MAG: GWxTD domain-containing protein [Salinivirgaceae bacterium]|nr:GWxTD domain-containing protein [Salinivirgaceae bacterium]
MKKNRITFSRLNFLISIGFGLIILIVYSCVTTYDTISNRNFADIYNPAKVNLHPEFSLFMKSKDEYRLYFRFFPTEFAYVASNGDSIPKAKVELFFRVTKDYKSIEIIDSLSQVFIFSGKPRAHFLGFIPVNFPEEGNYVVEVFLTDKLSKQRVSKVLDVKVDAEETNNSFMLLSQHGNPLFKSHFSINDSIRIRSDMFNSSGLNVSYYTLDTTLPKPPDDTDETYLDPLPIDSSWFVNNPDTTLFSFSNEGIYSFAGKSKLIGRAFVCTDSYFPYVKMPENLLSPLRYLCTKAEMRRFWKMNAPKEAVDTFWLAAANDVDKARELIRVYYNRVQLANYYFTDFKEGWLTDRGMIYIICGAPATIQKSEGGENWVYGKGATDEMKFYFYKDKHPVFGETFILDRSDLYTRIWFNAISAWREGRIFSLNF